MNPPNNLFTAIPSDLPTELFETLAAGANVRIERIICHGHASPPGFWYDQNQDEWVALLKGAAILRITDQGVDQIMELKPGDHLTIPAHRKHRVEWTTPDEPTIWLAVHIGNDK